jgi:hypothetical protein
MQKTFEVFAVTESQIRTAQPPLSVFEHRRPRENALPACQRDQTFSSHTKAGLSPFLRSVPFFAPR